MLIIMEPKISQNKTTIHFDIRLDFDIYLEIVHFTDSKKKDQFYPTFPDRRNHKYSDGKEIIVFIKPFD